MLKEIQNGDIILKCHECGEKFVFTVNEQEFYKEKGFTSEPKRCWCCRKNRKKYIPREK